jgi:UDP-N-acetylmuramate--alanine ligase
MTSTPTDLSQDLLGHPWFFAGIGGSGMLPLAMILKGEGAEVAGSDRSHDQGRTPEKFAWLERHGFALFPQDGSGLTSAEQTLVASAAIEDTVPEVIRARELGCPRMSRAELLAALFNSAPQGIAVGGTSGKSTVTGMLGWIMHEVGRDPTIMNGAVMKNFVSPDVPFASARVGKGGTFVSEVDESDGSIVLYRPEVAVLNNITLDHKSLEELHVLFSDFVTGSRIAIVNADDEESTPFLTCEHARSFGFREDADYRATGFASLPFGSQFEVSHERDTILIQLQVPGHHNALNALAAIAASNALGVPMSDSARALATFTGLARRFDVIGTSPGGVTVIDDFGHNPEKCRATLRTLKAHPGRVIAFFQPHGYGPLRQMGHELAQTFAAELGPDDVTLMCDPVYFGGTVDRSQGSERIVELIEQAGGRAEYIASREACGNRITALARPGDRVVVMGARDDTLTEFAKGLLARLP